MVISSNEVKGKIPMNGAQLEEVSELNYLGATIFAVRTL